MLINCDTLIFALPKYDVTFQQANASEVPSTENFVYFSKANKANGEEFNIMNARELEIVRDNNSYSRHPCSFICVFQDDKMFSGLLNGLIKLWSLKNGICLKTFKGHTKRIECLFVLSDNARLASGSRDNSIRIWDIESANCLHTLTGHTSWINQFHCLADNSLISGSDDGTAKIWDLSDYTLKRTLTKVDKHVNWKQGCMCLKPIDESNKVVVGYCDGLIEIWDWREGVFLKKFNAHSNLIWALNVTEKGQLVSCSGDKTIKVWDLETCRLLRLLDDHKSAVLCFLILPGDRLLSGAASGDIKLWDLMEGKCLKTKKTKASVDQLEFFSQF